MTDQELQQLTDAVAVQTKDLINAAVEQIFKVNKGILNLTAGTHPILFDPSRQYADTDYQYRFKAKNSQGYDIGVEVLDIGTGGIVISVAENCTLRYTCYTFDLEIID